MCIRLGDVREIHGYLMGCGYGYGLWKALLTLCVDL